MQQVLFAGYPDALNNANATEYNAVAGGYTWIAAVTSRSQVVAANGKLKNLYVELDNTVGAADDTYIFTLMYDGAASALTCTIQAGASSGNDTAHEIDVVAGKLICLRVVSAHNPTNSPNAQWSMMFSGTTAKESLILGNGVAYTATNYLCLSDGFGINMGFDVFARQVIPTSGTIKNLYVSENTGAGTGTWSIAVTKNGVAQTLSCNVTVAAPTNNDIVNSFNVVAGDTVSLLVTVSGSITSQGYLNYGCTFVSNTDGESILLDSRSSSNLDTANTKFSALSTPYVQTAWDATETNAQQLGQICVLKKLYVLLSGTPDNGAGTQSYTFTVRNNTGSTAITTTISEAATTGNDTTNTATLAAGDNVALMCVPSGTPTARNAFWGLVCYIDPFPYIPKINYYVKLLAQ